MNGNALMNVTGRTTAARTQGAASVPARFRGAKSTDHRRRERARRLLLMISGAILAALVLPATRSSALDTLAYALAIASCGGLVFVIESLCIIVIQRCADIVRRGRGSFNGR